MHLLFESTSKIALSFDIISVDIKYLVWSDWKRRSAALEVTSPLDGVSFRKIDLDYRPTQHRTKVLFSTIPNPW